MAFKENSKAKIPAIQYLVRLGKVNQPQTEQDRIEETNIFPELSKESIGRINPTIQDNELNGLLDEITLQLDFDDLGKEFYKLLTITSVIKIIDFNNLNKPL